MAQTRRWHIRRTVADHVYSSEPKHIDFRDISFLGDDVFVGQSVTDKDWSVGRRVVELGVLAEALKGCKICGTPMHLHHTVEIQTYGLAAILKVKSHKK